MLGRSPTGAPPRRRGRHTLVALAAAGLLALGLAACAQADGGGGVASLSGQDQATTTTVAGGKDFQQARLEWAQCMRENGVDVPDPGADGRVRIQSGAGAGQRRAFVDDPDFDKAQKACEKHMQGVEPPAGFNPEQMQERVLALTKCLRDRGYDVPDPEFNGRGGVLMRMAPEGVDPESKEFQDALRDCQKQSGMDEMRRNLSGNGP
jgi:hypothetical protein